MTLVILGLGCTAPNDRRVVRDGAVDVADVGAVADLGADILIEDARTADASDCSTGTRRERPCGLNERGLQRAECQDGAWLDWSACEDPDVCADGDHREADETCEFGGAEACIEGAWVPECNAPPPTCAEGTLQQIPCGLNHRGWRERACADGDWVESPCADPDTCTDGAEQLAPCGLNGRGEARAVCAEGQWGEAACDDPDECVDGSGDEARCGPNGSGQQFRACVTGRWGEFGACLDGGDCENGAMQAVPCGLNERGERRRVCADGQWPDFGACDDDDVCVDEAREERGCGLNGRGTSGRRCVAGTWSEWAACADPDVCTDDEEEARACGINERGREARRCVAGAWGDWSACDDAEECRDGESESRACGPNQRGRQQRRCAVGAWGAWGECEDEDVCADEALESRACGVNGRGRQSRRCADGRWSDWAECADEDTCEDDVVEPRACGLNGRGVQTRECVAGEWSGWADCEDPDSCEDDARELRPCGADGMRERVCVDGDWGPFGPCNEPDQCDDGRVEGQACGYNDRGVRYRRCDDGAWTEFGDCADPDVCRDDGAEFVECPAGPPAIRSCIEGRLQITQPCEDPACLPDAFEPNDDPASAHPIDVGEVIEGLRVCGDRFDYYSFELDAPVRFRAEVQGDARLEVRLVDARGRIFSGGVAGAAFSQTQMDLAPGTYRLQVLALDPVVNYTLTTSTQPLGDCAVDPAPCRGCFDAFEPNDVFLSARRIPLDEWVEDLALCADDAVDNYAIPLDAGDWVDLVVDVRAGRRGQWPDYSIRDEAGFALSQIWVQVDGGVRGTARVFRGANPVVYLRTFRVPGMEIDYDLRVSVTPSFAACNNGEDDDNDGLIDREDQGCSDRFDDSEADDFGADCANGIDDDEDGQIDWPFDLDCQGAGHLTEWGPCETVEDTEWIEPRSQALVADFTDLPNLIEDECAGFTGEKVYAMALPRAAYVSAVMTPRGGGFVPSVSLRAHCDRFDSVLSCGRNTPGRPAFASAHVDPGTYFLVVTSIGAQEGRADIDLRIEEP